MYRLDTLAPPETADPMQLQKNHIQLFGKCDRSDTESQVTTQLPSPPAPSRNGFRQAFSRQAGSREPLNSRYSHKQL